jgi:hypothetical protein
LERNIYTQLSESGQIPLNDLNISSLSDISDTERGIAVAKQELKVMYQQCFPSQKKDFHASNS